MTSAQAALEWELGWEVSLGLLSKRGEESEGLCQVLDGLWIWKKPSSCFPAPGSQKDSAALLKFRTSVEFCSSLLRPAGLSVLTEHWWGAGKRLLRTPVGQWLAVVEPPSLVVVRDLLCPRGGGEEQVPEGVCAGRGHHPAHSPSQELLSAAGTAENLLWQKGWSKATSSQGFCQESFLGGGSAVLGCPSCCLGALTRLFRMELSWDVATAQSSAKSSALVFI